MGTFNACVGPFFWINDKLVAFPTKQEEGIDSGVGVIDGPKSHFTEYARLPYSPEHDYDYWPRGRVVFDKSKRKSIVYLDRCIKDIDAVRASVVEAYSLDPNRTSWKLDAHYKCHRCNPNYVDIVGC